MMKKQEASSSKEYPKFEDISSPLKTILMNKPSRKSLENVTDENSQKNKTKTQSIQSGSSMPAKTGAGGGIKGLLRPKYTRSASTISNTSIILPVESFEMSPSLLMQNEPEPVRKLDFADSSGEDVEEGSQEYDSESINSLLSEYEKKKQSRFIEEIDDTDEFSKEKNILNVERQNHRESNTPTINTDKSSVSHQSKNHYKIAEFSEDVATAIENKYLTRIGTMNTDRKVKALSASSDIEANRSSLIRLTSELGVSQDDLDSSNNKSISDKSELYQGDDEDQSFGQFSERLISTQHPDKLNVEHGQSKDAQTRSDQANYDTSDISERPINRDSTFFMDISTKSVETPLRIGSNIDDPTDTLSMSSGELLRILVKTHSEGQNKSPSTHTMKESNYAKPDNSADASSVSLASAVSASMKIEPRTISHTSLQTHIPSIRQQQSINHSSQDAITEPGQIYSSSASHKVESHTFPSSHSNQDGTQYQQSNRSHELFGTSINAPEKGILRDSMERKTSHEKMIYKSETNYKVDNPDFAYDIEKGDLQQNRIASYSWWRFLFLMVAGLIIPPVFFLITIGSFDQQFIPSPCYTGCYFSTYKERKRFSKIQKWLSFIFGILWCCIVFSMIGVGFGIGLKP